MTNAAVDLLLDTLRLRGGLSDDEVQARWNATELRDLARLVVFEGADVWLSRRLRQRGVIVPAAFREQLKAAVRETTVLNMRIDAQAVAVISRLTAAAIPCALIKGQARRAAASLYPFADARPVSDVDLLLPESQADEAWTLLCRNGFRRIYDDTDEWSADHHRPVLIDDSGVAVELHTTTSMSVSPAEAWRRATDNADVVLWTGVPTSVPNATELIWQALSHGVADGGRGYFLKTFLSIAAILSESPPIDWALIHARVSSTEVIDNESQRPVAPERIRRFLFLASSLAGTEIPRALLPDTSVDLRTLLAWRLRVLPARFGRAITERLLEESLRAEALMPMTAWTPRRGLLRALRRRSSSAIARLVYVAARAAR